MMTFLGSVMLGAAIGAGICVGWALFTIYIGEDR